jgi:hypothetical protein
VSEKLKPQPTMSKRTTEEIVPETDTEPQFDEESESDYGPENQLGLPENLYWRINRHYPDADKESNGQGQFLFNCRDGLIDDST